MRLRHQLLLVSLLTLALPWAGWRYTLAVERAQRADREVILLDNAALVERILSARLERLPDPLLEFRARNPAHEIAAHALTGPILVDGFDDDWRQATPPRRLPPPDAPSTPTAAGSDASPLRIALRTALGQRFFYFHVHVDDASPRVRAPALAGAPPHDHLVLIFDSPDGERHYVRIAPAAPGPLTPVRLRDDQPMPRLRAHWRAAPGGYAVEARIPMDMIGDRFGFTVLDADDGDGGGARYRGNVGTLPADVTTMARPQLIGSWRGVEPGLLIRPASAVAALLEQLRRDGQRLSVLDSAGWRIASAGSLTLGTATGTTASPAPSRRPDIPVAGSLLRWMLRREDAGIPTLDVVSDRPVAPHLTAALAGRSAALRYLVPGSRERDADTVVLSAAHPIRGIDDAVLGAILIEQSTDKFLTLTTPAFAGLMQTTLLASLIAALGLLGYATLLSLRIARLRNAAERAAEGVLRPGGRFDARMPLTGAGDELGDLARSFTVLLSRLRQQTEYLQTLAGKLSHELRTPLSIVHSSLENLTAGDLPDGAEDYVARAVAGSERLRAILTAMSEATRLEQSIESAEAEDFDLAALLADIATAYRDVYPHHDIACTLDEDGRWPMRGVPELIVQMLDKLVDNAAGFSPPDGRIELRLRRDDPYYALSVANEGPALPEQMRERLFDSMVSVRGDGMADEPRPDSRPAGDSPHLGLGLYISRLIAEYHGGSISAQNRPDGRGVVFTVRLPHGR
jgi:two-component system sensor histidine kinase ChvG